MDKTRLTDEYAKYIQNLVYRAGKTDSNYKIFGANSHKYKLNPVISLSTVRNVEKQYNIELPEEYVFFLTKIGNGGAGPDYGIYPLEKAVKYTIYLKDYTPDEAKNMPVFLDKSMTVDEWNRKTDIMEDMENDKYEKYEKSIFSGQLEIGTRGCTACMTLMIKGKYYGEVVNTYLEHYFPQFTNLTFMQWYERFFDWIVKDYDVGLFFSINNFTEDEIISLYNPASNFDTRFDLLSGLLKYKHISNKTIKFLYSLDDIRLNDLILHILLKSAGEKSLKFFDKLLDNKDHTTVVNRCGLMQKKYRDRYYDQMLNILYENNDVNKTHLLYFIKECEKLNPKDIMPYILNKSNPTDYRQSALFIIRECKNITDCPEDFIKLFNNNEIEIIKAALYCINENKIPNLVPVYKKLQTEYKDNKEIQLYLKRAFITNEIE